MRTTSDQLHAVLAKGLATVYLISGDEPLLAAEAVDAIRQVARAAQYTERQVFFIERGFDWDSLRNATQSLSLFSERRLIELRMPSGKPDKGASMLLELIQSPPPDTLLLVITDKLDQKASTAAWVSALERAGVWLPIRPVSIDMLPDWLCARAKRQRLTLNRDAAELIAARVEGNLLAAAQEIDKLGLLSNAGLIDLDLVNRSVGNSARYDVFELSAAAAGGDTLRAMQVLEGLKAEGVDPTLIMWAMGRELRGMWQARERDRLRSSERGSAWHLVSPTTPQSAARARVLPMARLMREAAHTDRIIKGVARGDAWMALRALIAGLSGALQDCMLSGRVA